MISQLYSLDAQRAGLETHVEVEADGLGTTVTIDGAEHSARSANDAIRKARQHLGEFLLPAQRQGVPWGLRVTVTGGVAVYGEWPLVSGGGGDPSFEDSPLVRIRGRWHDSSALSALENALEIVRAYTDRPGRRAAAA